MNCEIGMKNRFYGEDGEQCGVEQLALQYYAGEGGGWQGVHTESGIWLTIFGLLMWDIIFSDVPNVFRNKFQAGFQFIVIFFVSSLLSFITFINNEGIDVLDMALEKIGEMLISCKLMLS